MTQLPLSTANYYFSKFAAVVIDVTRDALLWELRSGIMNALNQFSTYVNKGRHLLYNLALTDTRLLVPSRGTWRSLSGAGHLGWPDFATFFVSHHTSSAVSLM